MELVLGQSVRASNLLLRSFRSYLPIRCTGSAHYTCHCNGEYSKVKLFETYTRCRIAPTAYVLSSNFMNKKSMENGFFKNQSSLSYRAYATESNKACDSPKSPDKPSIFQRMKQLTKDYWHILIPVHVVTSIGWASIFYVAAKNGVDIVGMLESINLSDKYLDLLRGSNAGHWAVTYALYKIFTPLRYTVTVGGTTLSIRYLNKWGYLKFKPPRFGDKEAQSTKCTVENTEKYSKAEFKGARQPEPPKT